MTDRPLLLTFHQSFHKSCSIKDPAKVQSVKSSQIIHPEATHCSLNSCHILAAKYVHYLTTSHLWSNPLPPYSSWITATLPYRTLCFTSASLGSILNTTASIVLSELKKLANSFCVNPRDSAIVSHFMWSKS